MELSPQAAADSSGAPEDRGGGDGGGAAWLAEAGDQHSES